MLLKENFPRSIKNLLRIRTLVTITLELFTIADVSGPNELCIINWSNWTKDVKVWKQNQNVYAFIVEWDRDRTRLAMWIILDSWIKNGGGKNKISTDIRIRYTCRNGGFGRGCGVGYRSALVPPVRPTGR